MRMRMRYEHASCLCPPDRHEARSRLWAPRPARCPARRGARRLGGAGSHVVPSERRQPPVPIDAANQVRPGAARHGEESMRSGTEGDPRLGHVYGGCVGGGAR